MRRRILKITTEPSRLKPNVTANQRIKPNNSSQEHRLPIPSKSINVNETTQFLTGNSDRVFIIGGGPSLNKINLSFLNNEDVICVNKAIDLIKNPKYFITMDYSFFAKVGSTIKTITAKAQNSHFIINKQHSYIQKKDGVYTDTRYNLKYEGLEHFSSVITANNEIDTISGFGKTIGEFCHGQNSGYCAIQFAILAGYKEIYLLGFDLEEPRNKEYTHFHSVYPAFSFDKFYKNLHIYKRHLIDSINSIRKYKQIRFYTLTPSSLEPIVPMVKHEKFFNAKTKSNQPTDNLDNLIVVAYYTIGTPYEAEANKLVNSLKSLNLNYDVVGVPNLGSWQANTRFKAKFMEDMLNKHKDKNLLYIDSDAIVHSRPILFKNYTADIAVRWQDFRWRKEECLSGTIFMANNDKTRELCRRWQNTNMNEGANATTFEQWNLGSVIKQMETEGKIKTDNLPPEYTMIFDSMRVMYPNIVPVIEHFQASRKLKNKI